MRHSYPTSMKSSWTRTGTRVCILVFRFTTVAFGQGLPRLPVLIPNMCPLEYCCLGDWSTTSTAVSAYSTPASRNGPVAKIPARTAFNVDSTAEVALRFGVVIVDKPVRTNASSVDDSTMLAPGDTVFLMAYDLEDTFHAFFRGKPLTVEAFWVGPPGMLRPKNTPQFGRVIRDLKSEWWVHTRRPTGVSGWINATTSSVRVSDACEPHPPSP